MVSARRIRAPQGVQVLPPAARKAPGLAGALNPAPFPATGTGSDCMHPAAARASETPAKVRRPLRRTSAAFCAPSRCCAGQVLQQQTAFGLRAILNFLQAIVNFFVFFFKTILNPGAANDVSRGVPVADACCTCQAAGCCTCQAAGCCTCQALDCCRLPLPSVPLLYMHSTLAAVC